MPRTDLQDYVDNTLATRSGRDSQRAKVYRWEKATPWWLDMMLTEPLSLVECTVMIRRAFKAFGYDATYPYIKDGRGSRVAHGGLYTISLPRWARNPVVVYHETAHSLLARGVARKRYLAKGRKIVIPGHGPEFVRLYIELLARYVKLDRTALCKSARAAKIKVAPKDVTIMLAQSVTKPPLPPSISNERGDAT